MRTRPRVDPVGTIARRAREELEELEAAAPLADDAAEAKRQQVIRLVRAARGRGDYTGAYVLLSEHELKSIGQTPRSLVCCPDCPHCALLRTPAP